MKTSIWRRWCQSLLHVRSAPHTRRRRSSLGVLALEDRVTPTLTPQMVLDVNANSQAANPYALTAVGSTTFFIADDGVHGQELWKSDGTAVGTTLVKEIYPGNFNGDYGGYAGDFIPSNLTNVNGTLFFTANDGIHGKELWKSDGTAAGTVLVKDFYPGAGGSRPYNLTNVNGTLFLVGYDDAHGHELWKSNGTAAGTVLVKDINPSWGGSNPRNLTNVNGTLFFTTWDYYGTLTPGLWKSDGTAAGTVVVKNLYEEYPGQDGLQPRDFTAVNSTLFFRGYAPATGWELWKSNGTAAGTGVVKDINLGEGHGSPHELTNVNGTLFFRAYEYNGITDTTGTELWKSNGTAAGTVIVKDINPGTQSGYPLSLTNVNGTLFFTALDANGGGLWKSNGTAAGTVLVSALGGNSANLTNVNGTLFFTSSGGTTGTELWKSNGTAAGTVIVEDIHAGGSSYPGNLMSAGGVLLFTVNDGTHGVELWKSDGTPAGTTLVKDIRTNTFSSYPKNFTDVNGTLFFVASDGVHGEELWKSDGTAAGTTLVKDIYPGGYTGYYGGFYPRNSSPINLTNVNGTLFFTADDGTNGWKLWKSDGTAAGTVLVSSLPWYPSNLTAVGATLFFTGDNGSSGTELWKSDGTAAGTTVVKDIYPGGQWVEYGGYYGSWWQYVLNSSSPGSLTNVNGTLFFAATSEAHSRELWKSDGTTDGTVLVKDIASGYAWSSPSLLTNVNGSLFFSATNGTVGTELWKSDGTAAGTVLVKDIRTGANGSYPASLFNLNGTLYFSAFDAASGIELWKSDGTTAGTLLVKDVNPGTGGSHPRDLENLNGTLFFTATTATAGYELWKSNGTSGGTALVKDIIPGATGSDPQGLTSTNSTLVFYANAQLWQSDGTAGGTVPFANVSSPTWFTVINGTLFFTAYDSAHGRELWKLVDDGSQSTSLTVGGFPVTVTAGVGGTFTVTAKYADGTLNTSYQGTVHFTSSDPQAVLPADYTFTAADQGVHTFTLTLKTAGTQSVTARDTLVAGVEGTQSGVTVNPAAVSQFTVAGFPATITAGVAGNFSVTARDAYGNTVTGYTGTVHFTSSDPQATLPGNYTFTAADAGVHTFTATLRTAGTRSVNAADLANATILGSQNAVVQAAAASEFVLSAPASVNAGSPFSLTVSVVDDYGNVVTGYRGAITFSSSDPKAKLPARYTFTAADQGVHAFTGLVLKKKGWQTITATAKQNSSLMGSVAITVL